MLGVAYQPAIWRDHIYSHRKRLVQDMAAPLPRPMVATYARTASKAAGRGAVEIETLTLVLEVPHQCHNLETMLLTNNHADSTRHIWFEFSGLLGIQLTQFVHIVQRHGGQAGRESKVLKTHIWFGIIWSYLFWYPHPKLWKRYLEVVLKFTTSTMTWQPSAWKTVNMQTPETNGWMNVLNSCSSAQSKNVEHSWTQLSSKLVSTGSFFSPLVAMQRIICHGHGSVINHRPLLKPNNHNLLNNYWMSSRKVRSKPSKSDWLPSCFWASPITSDTATKVSAVSFSFARNFETWAAEQRCWGLSKIGHRGFSFIHVTSWMFLQWGRMRLILLGIESSQYWYDWGSSHHDNTADTDSIGGRVITILIVLGIESSRYYWGSSHHDTDIVLGIESSRYISEVSRWWDEIPNMVQDSGNEGRPFDIPVLNSWQNILCASSVEQLKLRWRRLQAWSHPLQGSASSHQWFLGLFDVYLDYNDWTTNHPYWFPNTSQRHLFISMFLIWIERS